MTEEEKKLLLADLCGRLPYGVMIREHNEEYGYHDSKLVSVENDYFADGESSVEGYWINRVENVRPYLRPLGDSSDMTELEAIYFNTVFVWLSAYKKTDWLNEHCFDYRDLIGKGLALPAPAGMYEFE